MLFSIPLPIIFQQFPLNDTVKTNQSQNWIERIHTRPNYQPKSLETLKGSWTLVDPK